MILNTGRAKAEEVVEMSGGVQDPGPGAEPAADIFALFEVTDSEDESLGFRSSNSSRAEKAGQTITLNKHGDEQENLKDWGNYVPGSLFRCHGVDLFFL